MDKFPPDFTWGTAMSAYQTEGNNTNTDWWVWEHHKREGQVYPTEPSETGCDSYNRYQEDFALCKQLNTNAVRISIEWARIQPESDTFDPLELDHYRKVLKAAKDQGLKTFVTLHHFTNPKWFAKIGGWSNRKSPKLFCNYAKLVAEQLGDQIDFFMTINEPQVYAMMGYLRGIWPPNTQSLIKTLIVQINFMRAHNSASKVIKKIQNKPVGFAKNIVWYQRSLDSHNLLDSFLVAILNYIGAGFFLDRVINYCDFIGLNYYFTTQFKDLHRSNNDDFNSDTGWWIYPLGLYKILKSLKKYKKPIYITENGLADAMDVSRPRFIREMLSECIRAMNKGVDLRGYFYWSLIDNFEWHQGYWPKFGLVEVDRQNNFMRKPRPSFFYYSKICQNGSIDV